MFNLWHKHGVGKNWFKNLEYSLCITLNTTAIGYYGSHTSPVNMDIDDQVNQGARASTGPSSLRIFQVQHKKNWELIQYKDDIVPV